MTTATNNLSEVNAAALDSLKTIVGGIELLGTGEEATKALAKGFEALATFAKHTRWDLEKAAFAAENPGYVLSSDGYVDTNNYGTRGRTNVIDGIYLNGRYVTHITRRAVSHNRRLYSYRVAKHEGLGTFKTAEAAFEAYVASAAANLS